MTAPTSTITLTLRSDITATLARLRIARTVEDRDEIAVSTRRLDWLLDKINQQESSSQCHAPTPSI